MRQFFANFTAGVALDLSSHAFNHLNVVGCTFLAYCFEHCSTKPIWIRKSDGFIRITPPPENRYNFPFAWGDHVQRAREIARTTRQSIALVRNNNARATRVAAQTANNV